MAAKRTAKPRKKTASIKKKPTARKKTSARKPGTGKTAKKGVVINELKKTLLGILVLVSICLTTAMLADIFFQPGRRELPILPDQDYPQKETPLAHKEPRVPSKPEKNRQEQPETPDRQAAIDYEVFHDIDPIIEEPSRVRPVDKTPRIAIIIDDIGYDRKIAVALFDLHPNITFSVLPFSPFGRQISSSLHQKGAQLMLHLPMEPVQYPKVDPGPGALLTAMNPDELLGQVRKNIADIPHISGVNNHMGSRLTASADQMNQIFTILKKEHLFFIDSKTAIKSQGKASARLLKLRFAQRDVFLDNFQDIEYITGQFNQLIKMAERNGTAIGIGHPYEATLEALARLLPKLKNRIKVVKASELTHIPG